MLRLGQMMIMFFAATLGAIDYAANKKTKMCDEIYPPLFAEGWRWPPQPLPLVMMTSHLGPHLLERLHGSNAGSEAHGMAIHARLTSLIRRLIGSIP